MRSDSFDELRQERLHVPPAQRQAPAPLRRAGATVSVPPRPGPAAPFAPMTLGARLALLRPRPVRLRPPLDGRQ